MQQIKNWLAGKQNFIIGRAIYRAMISAEDDLIQLLDKGFTNYSHQKLIKAFQEHIDPTAAPIPKISDSDKAKFIDWPDDEDDDQPPLMELTSLVKVDPFVVKAIENEWRIPYKNMHHLISQLDQFGDANDDNAISKRMELAGQILDLEQQVNSIWAKKDEYELTGRLNTPVVDELVIPTDPVELAELINRIKKGIRNNKTRMQNHPDKSGYAEKYQMYKMQYLKVTGKHYQDKV
jgi:hypothetical protein